MTNAVQGGGGAIGKGGSDGHLVISGATFKDNHLSFNGQFANEGDFGGCIWLPSGSLTIMSSSFTSNCVLGNIKIGGRGGAIFCAAKFFSISGSVFESNAAGSGGAIFMPSGTSGSIMNSMFTNNSAAGSGGGILVQVGGSLVVESSVLNFNTAGLDGGAICSHGDLVLQNGTAFIQNHAGAAGGAVSSSRSTRAHSTDFVSNSATAMGGGVASSSQTSQSSSNLTFVLCNFEKNFLSSTGAYGAGVAHRASAVLSLHTSVVACSDPRPSQLVLWNHTRRTKSEQRFQQIDQGAPNTAGATTSQGY